MNMLASQIEMIDQATLTVIEGRVDEVQGLALRVQGMSVPIGASVNIFSGPRQKQVIPGEVIGFNQQQTIVMPLISIQGVRRGDKVVTNQLRQAVYVGQSMLGRVINGFGLPIDNKGPLQGLTPRPLIPKPVDPMDRPLIKEPLATGVRAIDTMLSIGRGQRIGAFAAPGVGKSTLMGMMARGTDADVSVVALVGERGREVRDFIENQLGEQGMKNTVVVCATGDESPLLRIRCALVATSVAEYFRDQGKDVMLIMDSLTRFCQAQRQVGLASGEPPTTKGYTPSVFSTLPILLERSGRTRVGSITGLYAVLVEGDDMDDPIADAARGVLDGHIVLNRKIAEKGHWPAIDVLASISRCAVDVIDEQHRLATVLVRRLLSAYQDVEDLLNIGAYASGSSADFDLAIASKPVIDQLLQQTRSETQGLGDFDRARKLILALAANIELQQQKLIRATAGRVRTP